ncbi:uncharacterized protein M6G45_008775 [Spheniscus humboldti]
MTDKNYPLEQLNEEVDMDDGDVKGHPGPERWEPPLAAEVQGAIRQLCLPVLPARSAGERPVPAGITAGIRERGGESGELPPARLPGRVPRQRGRRGGGEEGEEQPAGEQRVRSQAGSIRGTALTSIGNPVFKTAKTPHTMLMCHPAELLRTSWVLLAGLLVPLQQAAEAARPLERKATAVGSSVLLPGPDNVTRIYSMRWEYRNGTSSCTILQYYRGSHNPAIHTPYTGRAIFHPSNGSLLLEDVQESDSGIYKVTVNAGDRESLKILLEVLKPVSRPRLRRSALVAQATGEVL